MSRTLHRVRSKGELLCHFFCRESGKRCHASHRAARRLSRQKTAIFHQVYQTYRCVHCGYVHLTTDKFVRRSA